MFIFIHLDPSGSSRWLGNACLSPNCTVLWHQENAAGIMNAVTPPCSSSIQLHSWCRQDHATQVSFPAWLPYTSSSSSQCLPTVHLDTGKTTRFPCDLSFTFRLGEVKEQRGCIPNIPPRQILKGITGYYSILNNPESTGS